MSASLEWSPTHPYAVGVKDRSVPDSQPEYLHFDNKPAAAMFADLMTGEPNEVTMWVAVAPGHGFGQWRRVDYFLL